MAPSLLTVAGVLLDLLDSPRTAALQSNSNLRLAFKVSSAI